MKEIFDQHRWAIELVGLVSIVASLLFVGLQLMLENRVAVAEQFQNRAQLGHDAYISLSENENFIRMQAQLWENGFKPDWWNEDIEQYRVERNLTLEDVVLLFIIDQTNLIRSGNNFFQNEQGLLGVENYLEGQRISYRSRMNRDPIYRAVVTRSTVIPAKLIELIQEIDDELNSGN